MTLAVIQPACQRMYTGTWHIAAARIGVITLRSVQGQRHFPLHTHTHTYTPTRADIHTQTDRHRQAHTQTHTHHTRARARPISFSQLHVCIFPQAGKRRTRVCADVRGMLMTSNNHSPAHYNCDSTSKRAHKVIDAFLFNHEDAILRHRTAFLRDFVTTFAVVESHTTHSGHPKPLKNWSVAPFDSMPIRHGIWTSALETCRHPNARL